MCHSWSQMHAEASEPFVSKLEVASQKLEVNGRRENVMGVRVRTCVHSALIYNIHSADAMMQ